MMPIRRTLIRQPGCAGASMRTRMSRGSPSSPRVDGMKPKSNGNIIPSGSRPPSMNRFVSGSYLNLLRLPFGVSMIARQVALRGSSWFGNEVRSAINQIIHMERGVDMHEIRATLAPEQTDEAVRLARSVGIERITVADVYVHGPDARRQVVSVETSTPKARAFVEAMLG